MGRNIHQGVKISGRATSDPVLPKTNAGLEIKDAGIPDLVSDRLYNLSGKLFWNGEEISASQPGSERWSIKNGTVFRMGRVGIGTPSPASDLDVAGTITAKELKIQGVSGVPVFSDGKMGGQASFGDLKGVNLSSAKDGSILLFSKGIWNAASSKELTLNHSDLNLGKDDHQEYLNEERHSNIPHGLPGISVTPEGLEITSPISVKAGLNLSRKGVGVLVSRNGEVQSNATSDDVPEGQNHIYLSSERVEAIGDARYLMLGGENAGDLKLKKYVSGLDAEMVGGKHASDFAVSDHSHGHSSLGEVGENDHHAKVHPLVGDNHSVPNGVPSGFVAMVSGGNLAFGQIDLSDTSGDIQPSRIKGLSESEVMALRGVSSGIQEQLSGRALVSHSHEHSQLAGVKEDDHPQYLNARRLEEWFSSKTSDDLEEGDKHSYFDEISFVESLKTQFLTKTGEGWPESLPKGSNADSVDGIHASELSRVGHSHSHRELSFGPNDHHSEAHDLLGESHIVRDAPEGSVMFVSGRKPLWKKIEIEDLPDGIRMSKLALPVSQQELASLSGVKGSIQGQLDSKSDLDHFHHHGSLLEADGDVHPIYMTRERISGILSGLSTDDIRQGSKNRYFDEAYVKKQISAKKPVYFTDGAISLSFNGEDFEERSGKLCLKDKIGPTVGIEVASVHAMENVDVEGDIVAKKITAEGGVHTPSLVISRVSGVLKSADGAVAGGATLSDLRDVSTEGAKEGSIFVFSGSGWGAIPFESFVESIRNVPEEKTGEDPEEENFTSLNVAEGKFVVDESGRVVIASSGVMSIKNSVSVEGGDVLLGGKLGVGTEQPRAALDLFSGSMIGGTYSGIHANVLDLSASPSSPAVSFNMGSGAKLQFLSGKKETALSMSASDGSAASFKLNESGAKIDTSRFSVGVGNKEFVSISDQGISVGSQLRVANFDVGKNFGVNDGTLSPKNWILLRAATPEDPPTFCFPAGGSLKFGTLKSYDPASVWEEKMSFDGDGSLRLKGRLSVGVMSLVLKESENENVKIEGSGVVKLSAENAVSVGGFSAGANGDLLTVINVSGVSIKMVNESLESLPTNRIWNPAEVELGAGRSISMVYDGEMSRWLVIN